MAARKKATRKKATRKPAKRKAARKKKSGRKKSARRASGTDLAKRIEKELADLSKQIDKRLSPLRKEIDKAERKAGTGASRVIREARKRLNDIELGGQSDFKQFLRKRRRDLSHALTELSETVRPHRKKSRS